MSARGRPSVTADAKRIASSEAGVGTTDRRPNERADEDQDNRIDDQRAGPACGRERPRSSESSRPIPAPGLRPLRLADPAVRLSDRLPTPRLPRPLRRGTWQARLRSPVAGVPLGAALRQTCSTRRHTQWSAPRRMGPACARCTPLPPRGLRCPTAPDVWRSRVPCCGKEGRPECEPGSHLEAVRCDDRRGEDEDGRRREDETRERPPTPNPASRPCGEADEHQAQRRGRDPHRVQRRHSVERLRDGPDHPVVGRVVCPSAGRCAYGRRGPIRCGAVLRSRVVESFTLEPGGAHDVARHGEHQPPAVRSPLVDEELALGHRRGAIDVIELVDRSGMAAR